MIEFCGFVARSGSFSFSALDKRCAVRYNNAVAKRQINKIYEHGSVWDAVSRGHHTLAPLGEDEESTVQIRRNSHCRYGRTPPVGMLIVLCCKVSPGIWGVWRFTGSVPVLVFCRTPQNGFSVWGVLLLSFDCRQV